MQSEWDSNFKRLVQFKEKYKHCNVSIRDKDNYDLAGWIGYQRNMYKKK